MMYCHNAIIVYAGDILKYCVYQKIGKGGYAFDSIGLFVCLSVSSITQKVMNGLW